MDELRVSGQIIDVHHRRIVPGTVVVRAGRIAALEFTSGRVPDQYLLPGFVDAHVHVESSMMAPSEFARFAAPRGTVATVSDPHEIANVLGAEGVAWMVANGRTVPFKFAFGAPACVPATPFETAGATLDAAAVRELLERFDLPYLSEVMNFPSVLNSDADLHAKIVAARTLNRPVDGHAPGLRGEQARQYIAAGISTDHECVALDEALDKIQHGMKILIREGSAARNFAALQPLLSSHPAQVMLCSDDLHPDALGHGHIDRLVRWAIDAGHDLFDVLTAACVNPVEHYRLPVGLLRVGDPADFIAVRDVRSWQVLATYLDGECVAREGKALFARPTVEPINRFDAGVPSLESLAIASRGGSIRVIEAYDGQLITGELHRPEPVRNGWLESDVAADVLKIVVVNRYFDAPPAIGFVQGFGLKRGAIAGSVAHDSHNVVAVGTSDRDLHAAIARVVEQRGGLAVADDGRVDGLPLEIGGLMGCDGDAVAVGYARLDASARALGSSLAAPFMTLSFMALPVIPALKLTDKGLFDGRRFMPVTLHV